MGTLTNGQGTIQTSNLDTTITLATKNKFIDKDLILNIETRDENLVAENIKNGVNIFGIEGNYSASVTSAYDWKGPDTEFVSDLGSLQFTLADTNYSNWTPTTSAATIIKEGQDFATVQITDLDNYNYTAIWYTKVIFSYKDTMPTRAPYGYYGIQIHYLYKSPSNYNSLISETDNSNTMAVVNYALQDLNNNNGNRTVAYSNSYGIYATATSASYSNNNYTIKAPNVQARCSNSYLSVDAAPEVNVENTNITMTLKLYRTKRNVQRNAIQEVIDFYLTENPQTGG